MHSFRVRTGACYAFRVRNSTPHANTRIHGFDHVINYEQEDFTKSRKRYDLILDTKTKLSP
jgi:NADPH:quinone reductase-like Zn-dependent oxidoreductase